MTIRRAINTENIGSLRNRISIQTYADTPTGGSSGHGITPAWTTVATVWAAIEAHKGLVYYDGMQIGEGITHKISIRMPSVAVTTENWVLFGTRRFRIRFIRNIQERNRWLILECQEDRASGP